MRGWRLASTVDLGSHEPPVSSLPPLAALAPGAEGRVETDCEGLTCSCVGRSLVPPADLGSCLRRSTLEEAACLVECLHRSALEG